VSDPKLCYLKSDFTATFDKLLLCVQYLFGEHYPVPTGSCYYYAVVHGGSVKILPKSTGLQVGAAPVPALDDYDDACSDRNETVPKMVNESVSRDENLHHSETTPKTVDDGTSQRVLNRTAVRKLTQFTMYRVFVEFENSFFKYTNAIIKKHTHLA